MHRTLWILAAVLCLGFFNPGFAQSTDEEQAESDMDEETREAIANVGLLAGNAMQCSEKEQQEVIADQAFQGADLLAQDLGTHKAYLLMIYFGVGSEESIETDNCEQILSDWRTTVDDYALDVK